MSTASQYGSAKSAASSNVFGSLPQNCERKSLLKFDRVMEEEIGH